MAANKLTGVLLVGFGGPRSLDEVAPMLQAVMGFNPPVPVVASAKRKYEAIGGSSPIVPIAQEISEQLEVALRAAGSEAEYVHPGMCFTAPRIAEGLACLAGEGCERVIFLSMTPYESWAAWGLPLQMVREAAAEVGITEVLATPAFGLFEPYLSGHMTTIRRVMTDVADPALVFVAHSLPLDDELEDPLKYENQLREACDSIASAVGVEHALLAFTSVGARGGQWLGPNLSEVLNTVAAAGTKRVVVCPLGFATDHMEVLYDLDLAARAEAEALGLDFVRTPTLATAEAVNPALIEAMATSVTIALEEDE